jgi:hypothetical protein
MQQLSYACCNEIVPKKNRGVALGIMSLAAIPGSAFGTAIGM